MLPRESANRTSIPPGTRDKPGTRDEPGTLDEEERDQVAEHASIRALVIHEVLREEGEAELERQPTALAWSGLAAGLSMGFSFLGLVLIRSALPAADWALMRRGRR